MASMLVRGSESGLPAQRMRLLMAQAVNSTPERLSRECRQNFPAIALDNLLRKHDGLSYVLAGHASV
jgi:hypothetical protein